MSRNHQKLFTPAFLVLCLSYAFFGASFNMIIPELPAYLTSLGGAEYKGLIIALFTLTAGLSRPFSGKLTDIIGRKPIIIFGTLVCIVCSSLYPIVGGVGTFLLLRLIHGFSTGFSPTAINAYIADIVPIQRRGEAMGMIGVSINVGSAISPPIGGFIANSFSLYHMFWASSCMAAVSMLLLIRLPETLSLQKKFKIGLLKITKHEIIAQDAILPAMVCGLSYLGYGAILTITPDQCDFLGMSNKGIFFTSFTFCSILSRLVAGRISDIYGRVPVMRIAIVLLAISYVVFGWSDSPRALIVGAGLVGFSLGIVIPSVFAWTIDRSADLSRGRSLATLFIGLEFAIGGGALIGARVYNNDPDNFSTVFLIVGVITLVGLFFCKNGTHHESKS